MGTTYAIDFIPVDEHGRSAPWSWRAAVATEPPEIFVGFGAPILAPCPGRVVIATDQCGPYILLAHLQRGSVTVTVGDHVPEGTVIDARGKPASE